MRQITEPGFPSTARKVYSSTDDQESTRVVLKHFTTEFSETPDFGEAKIPENMEFRIPGASHAALLVAAKIHGGKVCLTCPIQSIRTEEGGRFLIPGSCRGVEF